MMCCSSLDSNYCKFSHEYKDKRAEMIIINYHHKFKLFVNFGWCENLPDAIADDFSSPKELRQTVSLSRGHFLKRLHLTKRSMRGRPHSTLLYNVTKMRQHEYLRVSKYQMYI